MRSMKKTQLQSGFSIIELMITLLILTVLLSFAVPNFRELRLNTRTTGIANDLVTAFSLARGEAVKLNRPVLVTATGGSWENGWVLTQDIDGDGTDDQLFSGNDIGNFTLSAADGGGVAAASARFNGLGQVNSSLSFQLNRAGGTADKGRMICLAANGQVEVRKGVTSTC